MGKEWAKTPEQKAYLESQVAPYTAARIAGRQEPFMKAFIGGWLERWSEQVALFGEPGPDTPPLTKEQLERVGTAVLKRRKVCIMPFIHQSQLAN